MTRRSLSTRSAVGPDPSPNQPGTPPPATQRRRPGMLCGVTTCTSAATDVGAPGSKRWARSSCRPARARSARKSWCSIACSTPVRRSAGLSASRSCPRYSRGGAPAQGPRPRRHAQRAESQLLRDGGQGDHHPTEQRAVDPRPLGHALAGRGRAAAVVLLGVVRCTPRDDVRSRGCGPRPGSRRHWR